VEWLGIPLHHACAVCCRFREQSLRFGTRIFTETVNKADLSRRPFKLYTDEKEVTAQTVIIATGAVAKRLPFKGSDEDTGFWNKGISACAVCDGAAPIFRNKPIAVIGGGDSAMEEAMFLTKYGSEVRAAQTQQGWHRCVMVPAYKCKGMATHLRQLQQL
jgi:thioredoxin reductase (NADPH)